MIFNKKNNRIFYIKLPKSNFYFRPKGDFGALSQFVNISYSFKVDETKSFKILDLGAVKATAVANSVLARVRKKLGYKKS